MEQMSAPGGLQDAWSRKTTLLAIDPGAKTGWALFLDIGGWRLQNCGVTSADSLEEWPGLKKLDQVVIESPIRPNPGTPRPADILTLARNIGRYQERFKAFPVELVEPRAWKGTVQKDIMTNRIIASLSQRDLAVHNLYKGGYAHNMTDAVGLGLWAVKQPFMRAPRRK